MGGGWDMSCGAPGPAGAPGPPKPAFPDEEQGRGGGGAMERSPQ